MWIRAILCTKDVIYGERLASFFDKEYGSKIELNLCSSVEAFFDYIGQNTIDVALFGDEFAKEAQEKVKDIPCLCVLITDQIYEANLYGLDQVKKFQKGDRIYKDIFDLYSSGKKVRLIDINQSQNETQKTYVFTSAGGGSGATTIAMAYARKCAVYEKVLYLSMSLFHQMKVIDGNVNGMDEVILALKSRRNILPLKLVSAVAYTEDKIFTYGACSNACNLLELNAEDVRNLMDGIGALSEYKKIIVDIGSSFSSKEVEFMKNADAIICITDESDIGKEKYRRFYNFLEDVGSKEHIHLVKKLFVFRNKIRQSYEVDVEDFQDRLIGWAPYVSMYSFDEIVDRIAQSDSFIKLEMRNE